MPAATRGEPARLALALPVGTNSAAAAAATDSGVDWPDLCRGAAQSTSACTLRSKPAEGETYGAAAAVVGCCCLPGDLEPGGSCENWHPLSWYAHFP